MELGVKEDDYVGDLCVCVCLLHTRQQSDPVGLLGGDKSGYKHMKNTGVKWVQNTVKCDNIGHQAALIS